MEPDRQGAIPAFRYTVDVGGFTQGAFTECTLPTIDWEIQEVKEGGLNAYTHQLPGRRKKATLTLKNGIATNDLFNWCLDVMNQTFERKTISIQLLDLASDPIIGWDIEEAYPIKWTGPVLKSSENTIAMQTLEFACGLVSVKKLPG